MLKTKKKMLYFVKYFQFSSPDIIIIVCSVMCRHSSSSPPLFLLSRAVIEISRKFSQHLRTAPTSLFSLFESMKTPTYLLSHLRFFEPSVELIELLYKVTKFVDKHPFLLTHSIIIFEKADTFFKYCENFAKLCWHPLIPSSLWSVITNHGSIHR